MRAGGLHDVLPEGAGADAGDALLRVDGRRRRRAEVLRRMASSSDPSTAPA